MSSSRWGRPSSPSWTRLGLPAPHPEDGFAAGQPEYVFQVPLAGRTEADVLAGMNQLWRRNIKKTEQERREGAGR